MAGIRINIGTVIGLSPQIQRANGTVSGVKADLNSTRSRIDGRILNRKNLSARLQSVSSQLSSIETRISRIKNTVEYSVNSYNATELKIKGWGDAFTGRIAGVGASQGAAFGLAASFLANQAAFKTTADSKESADSTFKQILKDDWKLEGAVFSKRKKLGGAENGSNATIVLEGDALGGSIKTKSKANWKTKRETNADGTEGDWDLKHPNVGIEKSIEAEAHGAKGKVTSNVGLLGSEIEGTVGSVGATGSIGASLYKDGKLSPALEAKLKGEASLLKGNATVNFGNEEFDAHLKSSGTLLGAEAEASGGIGMITYTDSVGMIKTELGVRGKVGAEAYVAQGKASGGFTLWGIKLDVGVSGKVGGAGASLEGQATAGGVSGKIGAGLGVGLGLEISIDWSNFSLW